jgi:type II secretory pathway pseudopilin PulG
MLQWKVTSLLKNPRGTSLIEVVLGAVILAILAITTTLFFSNASRSAINSQRHWEANNLAASRMEDFKNHPYALIPIPCDPGTSTNPNNPCIPIYPAFQCDCGNEDFTQYPSLPASDAYFNTFIDTVVVQGMLYTRDVCVGYVDSNLANPSCTPITNVNLKTIRVHVTWTTNAGAQAADVQSLAVGP